MKIFVDLKLAGCLVASWKFRTLTRALAQRDEVNEIVRARRKEGYQYAEVSRGETGVSIVTDEATLRTEAA